MNFSVVFRYNPQTGRDERYFRMKESCRDATGAVRNRLVLTVGFEMNDIPMEEVRQVAVGLTDLWQSNGVREDAFGDRLSCFSETVRRYIDRYWRQILEKKRLDIVKESIAAEHSRAGRLVDVDTIKHTDAREVGAEWVCLQAVRELGIDLFLEREGWTETQINTALALCINHEGFIRYSSILAGNTADPDSLPDMVDTLRDRARVPQLPSGRTLVCLDAGIATEENLRRIREKGYNYLCVSRTRLTDYELAEDCRTVTVKDSREQPISLRQVMHREGGDLYLEITSPAKAMKESSMNRLFKERFETELQKARDALTRKGGKKTYEKVIERVGRAIGKYPSISKYYIIDYIRDDKNPRHMADIRWRIAVPENVDRLSGVYFLRTNVATLDEKTTWDYYNLIREIECTNRQLKTDLELRPIFHQKDDRSDAHLFLGLLSYWIVNTIRHKMKLDNLRRKAEDPEGKYPTPYWTEIVRTMSTQKAVTTKAVNALGEKVKMRICSEPTKAACYIYEQLKYKKMPFRKIKVCSTQ